LIKEKKMSATESQEGLSEDKAVRPDWPQAGQEELDNAKLVPVGESIRYHRRAKNAEKRAEELAGELADARAEATRLANELKATQTEQELMRRLTLEGACDLEAAMLIVKARLASADKADLNSVVEQLKREKQYLFGEKTPDGAAMRTSPAKGPRQTGATAIEKAASRATRTGNRMDLQEYMRKRRNSI
jgi:glutamate mutase epsilon subunit